MEKNNSLNWQKQQRHMIIQRPLRWAAGFFGGFVVILTLYLTGHSIPFDIAVMEEMDEYHTPFMTKLLSLITKAGEGAYLAPFAILMILAVFLLRYRLEALLLLVTLGGCEGISETLKDLFARTRPNGYNLIELPSSYSMPSGHALVSAVFFTLITLLLVYKLRGHWARWWVAAAGYSFVLLICASRVYLGVHYPTDVVAGYCLGMAWMFVVYAFYQRYVNRQLTRKKPQELTTT